MWRTYPLQVFFAVILALAALAVAGCGGDDAAPPEAARFDADRASADLEAQVEIGPRPAGSAASRELTRLLASRLADAGARNVAVQKPYRNVVAVIPGEQRGAIVVGAHHDTKDIPGFVGANDGASGVAVVLELARVLAAEAPLDGPSVAIALFDAEEARGDRDFEADGTRGSRQYVAYAQKGKQGSPRIATIESMILFDMVGDCDLKVPLEEGSDPEIYALFAAAATETNAAGSPAPFEGSTGAIADDHVPFIEAGIPALDIIDFTYGSDATPGPYWHSTDDTLDKVCPESLDAVGEPAALVLNP